MTTATITLEINGQTVPARDASWYLTEPCGCTSGVTVVTTGDERFAPNLTEDDAWKSFHDNAEHIRRDKAAGARLQLGLRADVRKLLVSDCPHTPKWGREPKPEVDGHEWATTSHAPGARDRQHLVASEAITHDNDRLVIGAASAHALCGKPSWAWYRDKVWTDDAPTCRRCEKAANDNREVTR